MIDHLLSDIAGRIRRSTSSRDYCSEQGNKAFQRSDPELGHLLVYMANHHGEDIKEMAAFAERAARLVELQSARAAQ